MKRRLLLDSEAVVFLEGLSSKRRRVLWNRLREIAEFPDRFADYYESIPGGRELAVHIFGGYAIVFWDDVADRHVKILEISSADDF